ncbi:MAG: hypothetical protein ACYS5V_03260 [Planctomycetota bacterium]|jgi:hypothetical protein
MSASFGNFSDDYFVNMDLHTSLPLPTERETVLSFCEVVQKQFPDLSDFYRRDNGPYVLEGDRNAGSYRWMELSAQQLSSGTFNPADADDAYAQHGFILDRSRYFLGISHLDVESLDLVYGFNLDFAGNRDMIVSDALLDGSRLSRFLRSTGGTALNCEPSIVVSLDAECFLQARIAIETRNSSYQVRTGVYDQEPISVYFTVRAYPHSGRRFDMGESLKQQGQVGEDLLNRVVIPSIVRPIAAAIAAAQ